MKKHRQQLAIFFFLGILTPCISQVPEKVGTDFESALIKALEIKKLEDGHYFIDFGTAFFGTLVIRSGHTQDTPFSIHLGENLSASNRLNRNPPYGIVVLL